MSHPVPSSLKTHRVFRVSRAVRVSARRASWIALLVLALPSVGCEEEKKEEPRGSAIAFSREAATFEFGTSALCHAASVPPGSYRSCDGVDSIPISPGMIDAKVFPTMTVALDGFAVEVTEVSNAQYARCVEEGGCTAPKSRDLPGIADYYRTAAYANHPVVNVTWEQARAYCAWAGRRLPSEYEWERVAGGALDMAGRGGRYVVPAGAETPEACVGLAVNVAYCGGDGKPAAVGTSADDAVEFAGVVVHDLAGNVAEWVDDRFAADVTCAAELEGCGDCFACRETDPLCNQTCNDCPACLDAGDICYVECPGRGPSTRGYPICLMHTETVVNPGGPSEGTARAVRGGDYALGASDTCRLRVSGRSRFVRSDILEPWEPDIGFRCAAEPPPLEEEE